MTRVAHDLSASEAGRLSPSSPAFLPAKFKHTAPVMGLKGCQWLADEAARRLLEHMTLVSAGAEKLQGSNGAPGNEADSVAEKSDALKANGGDSGVHSDRDGPMVAGHVADASVVRVEMANKLQERWEEVLRDERERERGEGEAGRGEDRREEESAALALRQQLHLLCEYTSASPNACRKCQLIPSRFLFILLITKHDSLPQRL